MEMTMNKVPSATHASNPRSPFDAAPTPPTPTPKGAPAMALSHRILAAQEELEALESELEVVSVASADSAVDIHDSIALTCSRIRDRVRVVRVSLSAHPTPDP